LPQQPSEHEENATTAEKNQSCYAPKKKDFLDQNQNHPENEQRKRLRSRRAAK